MCDASSCAPLVLRTLQQEPPHNNLARDEYSAERRGPDVEVSVCESG
jgi:hypothetical protein